MNSPMRKTLKRIGISLLIIVGLLVIFATFFLKGIVNNQLKKEIKTTFGGFYTLTFQKSATSLSTSGFNVQYQGVTFRSDTSSHSVGSLHPPLFFKAEKLDVLEINVFELLFGSTIKTGRIEIDRPEMIFFVTDDSKAKTNHTEKETSQPIRHIVVGKLNIKEGKASFLADRNHRDTLGTGQQLDLTIENLNLNIESNLNFLHSATLDQFKLALKKLKMKPRDGQYSYSIDQMHFDYQKEVLRCLGLSMEPQGNPVQMAAHSKYRRSVFQITTDSMVYHSDNFRTLKNRQSIDGSSLKLYKPRVTIHRHKSLPLNENQYKRLFHESLLALPLEVELDSVQIIDGHIDYRIYSNEVQPGNLVLSRLNALIAPINTRQRTTIQAQFNGRFMNASAFWLQLNLPLSTPEKHSYKGEIESMKFTALNPLIANLTRVQMENGTLEHIAFSGTGGTLLNQGQMTLRYSDFKFSLTNKANDKRWLQSGLGNLLVRGSNKTDKQGEPLTISYSYKRPPYKDHLDLYAGGLIDGFAQGVLPKLIYQLVMQD